MMTITTAITTVTTRMVMVVVSGLALSLLVTAMVCIYFLAVSCRNRICSRTLTST